MRLSVRFAGYLSMLLLSALALAEQPALRLGIMPFNSTLALIKTHQPLRQHLEAALGRPVEIFTAADYAAFHRDSLAGNFDLLITDINMPIMDGLKLVSLVRGNPVYKDIPIIIITTEGAEEDKKRALAIGANAYLPKPIQTQELIKLVTTYLTALKK